MNPRPRLVRGLPLLLASPALAQETILDLVGDPSTRFGHACDVVGDTNGDGFGEVLVSAPNSLNGSFALAGSVTLHSGATGQVLVEVEGVVTFGQLGRALSAVGDVNGDGHPDYCATSLGTSDPGTALVLSGLDGSELHRFTGPANGRFGWATAGVGDVDGDGRGDVLVSAPSRTGPAGPGSGSLRVFSGADGSLLHEVFGVLGGGLGTSVGRVGDVDGDGLADFAGLESSTARVFSGADGSEIWRRSVGRSDGQVSGGIDANGDGFDDFVIGSRYAALEMGRVQLVSGRDNSLLFEAFGTAGSDRLGAGVTGAGDLDGDGYGDFAASMPGFDGAAGADVGAVRAYSGRTGAVIATVEGDVATAELGWSLGGGRDVNGDGIPDVIAGGVRTDTARAISFVPRGLEPFGTGTPGCRGSSTLLANGVPTLGNAGFALHASSVGATPLLLIGDSEDTAGSILFNVRFHLDFDPLPPAVGLVLAQPLPAPDANGSLVVPLPIPGTPGLVGRTFVLQVASAFPSGTCARRLATSRGLRVTIQ